MSKSSEWEGEIKAGKLLDASKPTAVMCRSGVRSMRMAQFLVNEAKFAHVTPSPPLPLKLNIVLKYSLRF